VVKPQFDALKSNKVSSLIKDSLNTTFESQHSVQGALALAKGVTNNPMLQFENDHTLTKFRDLISQKDVYTSH
jgi:hypothetical protein